MSTKSGKKKKGGGIKNNPRLKPRSAKDDDDDDSKKEPLGDYQYIINCLTTDTVLRPQEILEFIAITIKIYVGTHLALNMHQKTFIIDCKNKNLKCLLKSMQSKEREVNIENSMKLSLPINVKELHDFTRVGLIVPIIYQIPAKNNDEESKDNDDEKKDYYNNNARDVIAILQERKTRISFNDFRKGIIYPYILDNVRYEWNILNNVYMTTIQKNYKWQRALIQQETNNARRTHLEQTFLSYSYGKTKNVTKCVILCDPNSALKLCLFSTSSGLFYTEPRINYSYYDKGDTNYNYQMNISIPLLYRKEWERDEKEIFTDFWTQGNNDIYVWNYNDDLVYNVTFNNLGLDTLNKDGGNDLNEMIKSMDASQNTFEDGSGDNDNDNDDENKAQEMDPDIMNAKLSKYNLLSVNQLFKLDSKKTIYAKSVRPQKDHCEIKCVYYQKDDDEYIGAMYWCERSKFGQWRFGGISINNVFKTSKQKSIQSKLRSAEKRFYQTAPDKLTEESFFISFIDDRDIKNKRAVIILKKHIVIIPLLRKEDVDNEHNSKPFAYCLDVKDVVPKVLLMKNEIRFNVINQWFYNYSNTTMYIFEKMAAGGVYPYRMNEIALNAFKFD